MENQAAYWDSVAWEKVFSIPFDADVIRSLAGPEARILDYGCGYGRTCGELRDLGYRDVTGIDCSSEMVRKAQMEHPDIQFDLLNDRYLPYEDASFDVVFLYAVLTCIPSDEDQIRVIEDIQRVLKPGGLIYIGDFPIQDDQRNRARYREFEMEFGTYGVFRLPEGVVVRHQDITWIHSLTSCFTERYFAEMLVTTMNGNSSKAFQYIGSKRH
jgi:SAM-dependent methyltransferase